MEQPGKVIVIGAGIAGLCSAVYARKCGYDVELFEQHESPGGLATSWRRGEYTFENSLSWLLGSKPGGMLHDEWREVFDVEALTFVDAHEYVRVETENGESLIIYRDVDRLEAELLRLAPEDAGEIRRLTSMVRRLARGEIPELTDDGVRAFVGLLRAAPILPALRWWAGLALEEYRLRFKHPLLKRVIADEISASMAAVSFPFVLAWMNDRNAGYPIGGSHAVIRPIVEVFEKLGGRLHCNAPVGKVLVERDAAVGVQLKNGETVRGDWVISAADGHETIYELLGGRYTDTATNRVYATRETFPSYVQVALGVARDLSQHGGTVIWVPDTPLNVDPETALSQMTVRFFHFDPTFAPPGKTAVTCILPTRDYSYWVELQKIDPTRYQAEKDRVAQSVISTLDKGIPGLRAAIEVHDVSTPATVIRYTRNWKGSSEGWLPTPGTGLTLPNTLPGLHKFLMAGQWVAPGGGFPLGLLTARRAVRRLCRYDHVAFLGLQHAGTAVLGTPTAR